MKNLSLYIFLFTAIQALAQQGILKESLSISSKILNKEVEYSIYLPYDYDISSRKYPVLYLLHGYTDDETAWTQFGELKTIADQQIGNTVLQRCRGRNLRQRQYCQQQSAGSKCPERLQLHRADTLRQWRGRRHSFRQPDIRQWQRRHSRCNQRFKYYYY